MPDTEMRNLTEPATVPPPAGSRSIKYNMVIGKSHGSSIAFKYEKLKSILAKMGKVLIAYSGGVDSTFLLAVARQVLGKNVLAVIASSPTYPKKEQEAAEDLCKKLEVEYLTIKTDEFEDENFVSNPRDRCYYCKSELFSKLLEIAQDKNIPYVLDGSNLDDLSDFRPGAGAKKELGVRSSLQEAGLNKNEIRTLSRELDLPTWDKPSFACLSSRIPYGTRITEDLVKQIEEGEDFLRNLGFKELRVRHHGPIVRIEVGKSEISRILQNGLMEKINHKFKDLGYAYVTLDLTGYHSGSMNLV